MPPEPATDLDWTAFRYVSGDLSPAEASAFESILGDDQDAREAVAAAVELAGALAIAVDGPILALPRRRTMARRLAAGSVAAAVAAAACLLVRVLPIPSPAGCPDAPAIARAWSGLRSAADGDWASIVSEGHEPASTVEAGIDDHEADAAERAVPSWMLAAAAPSAPPREGN